MLIGKKESFLLDREIHRAMERAIKRRESCCLPKRMMIMTRTIVKVLLVNQENTD